MRENEMAVIRRRLKDTSFEVSVELSPPEYAHFRFVEGGRPCVSMPMDIEIMREMIKLAAHFERPGWREIPFALEDEARDAAEMAGEG